jgi:GAF domain
MLQDEYDRLAKTLGYVSEKQARDIISLVLDKVKRTANAGIVEIWTLEHGMSRIDILRSYIRIADKGIPNPQNIALTNEATGLLAWIVEKRKPIWINDIKRGATSGRNLLTDEKIEGRYFNLYDGTRAFAAVPIEHRDQLSAILTIEVTDENHDRLDQQHVDLLKEMAEGTAILMWKASVYQEHERQAEAAINYFRVSADTQGARRYALNRTGFIARPFKPDFDFVSESIETAFSSAHVQATTYRPMAGRSYVVEEMLEQINVAHFGVAEITGLNQNVLIETGVMIGIAKPLIILREGNDVTPLPFDIAGHQVFRYSQEGEKIIINSATKSMPLQGFITDFMDGLLKTNREFKDARPWYGN